MRSQLIYLINALDNVYSGWILWNLFLAFVPLLLSFRLFRPKAIPKPWFWTTCVLVGAIGMAGFWQRSPISLDRWISLLGDSLRGDLGAFLRLSWLAVVMAFVVALGLWGLNPRQPHRAWLWGLGVGVFLALLPNAPYVLTDIVHLIRGLRYEQLMPAWVVILFFLPIHLTAIVLGFEAYVISILNVAYYLKQQEAAAWILPTELLIHALCAVGIFLGRFIRFNSWDLLTDPLDVAMVTLNALTSKRPLAVVGVIFLSLTALYWVMKQITLGLKLRIRYAQQGLDVLD
ncbi:MAG TPA: DUF1361 domain-containing protein [Leptolyngbyaceae cyanobacterium M65_K2018_010]|nr:DUF1361 domain-containing protein [Leptolyngbyaceae cyanobacterium M65_K2018_010]